MQGMLLRIFAAIVLVLGLAGCGMNGGTNVAGGGTGGTGISVGTISAVQPVTTSSSGTTTTTTSAHIFVNGVQFTVDQSTNIQKDDAPATIDDLFDGLVVEVYGTISNGIGTADKVITKDIVRGVVESNDGVNTIVVAGQTIIIDDLTVFNPPDENPASPSPPAPGCNTCGINDPKLAVGSFIEAYGLLRGPGAISARYFESRSATGTTTKVRGIVSSLDTTSKTFTIGGLTVNYASATVGVPLVNGVFVEVEGLCTGTTTCDALNATTVVQERFDVANADVAQVEGFVTTQLNPAGQFTVGSQAVAINSSTVFAGGVVTDIAVGVRLEVDGTLSNGVITATTVVFKDNVELEADIASVDTGAGTLTLSGLSGITVTTNGETLIADTSSGSSTTIALADLVPQPSTPNHVRIRGRILDATTETVLATQIERTSVSSDSTVVLQGPVQTFSSTAPTSVTILGIPIDTDAMGMTFKDQEKAIDLMTFFTSLHVDDIVKAKGTFGSPDNNWQEVELEN